MLPGGNRALLGQGSTNDLQACMRARDEIYFAQHQGAAGWINPTETGCPALSGGYATVTQCGWTGAGPLGSPSVTKIGSKYFMAFGGGNADTLKGHVFWATSTDGVVWTPHNALPRPTGYKWTPIVWSPFGTLCAKAGVGQVSMVYDSSTAYGPEGAFYLYVTYWHQDAQGTISHYMFRFKYSSAAPSGIGGGMQVCLNQPGQQCVWTNHSGAMVFPYTGMQPAAGDPVLPVVGSAANMGFGAGDIKWNPERQKWLRIYTAFDEFQYWQEAGSLASGLWSAPFAPLDMNQFHADMTARFGGQYDPSLVLYGGLYYGTFGGRTGMWLFQPISYRGCTGGFERPGVVSAGLNFN